MLKTGEISIRICGGEDGKMIEALWDFFGLYKAGSDYLPDFWLTMILLYLNAGLYLADLYHLVKRKSKAETVSLMAIPGVFAVLLVSVASVFIQVPNLLRANSRVKCLSLLITTMLPETNLALLLVVFLYPILWGIGLWRQRKHEHGSRKRWVLSCIPDYIAWIILICGISYHLLFGKNILHSVLENAKDGDLLALYGSHGIWLYIWMYGIYILACKEAVLLGGFLSEVLLMRIPLRYHNGKNAVTFVGFYYLFCQNAVFRGIFLMEAALVIPLCGVMLREAASPFSDHSSVMLYAAFLLLTGAVFVVLVVIRPVMRTLSCFDAWGQRKQIRELFCTEYFLMQPVFRNRLFTVTYHFIIDEQDAAGVYYLPFLTDISGWIYSKKKKGKWKVLTFADGRTLEVSEHEAEETKNMLSYASNWLYTQKKTGGNRSNINNMSGTENTWNPFINSPTTTYEKLVKFFLSLLIILFIMSYQILK